VSALYITQNGVTDHIGRSQVAPYVLGLAREGFRIHVLSAEKAGQEALIDQYQRHFDEFGVRWTRIPYYNRPSLIGQAWTQAMMKRAARRIISHEGIRMVHCRSFPPALIAHQLKSSMGIRYIFDFRDFYADGGLAKAQGLSRLVFWRLKQLEGPMIRAADKVVCLTNSATQVLTNWYLSNELKAHERFTVIPCCADFDHFNLERVTMSAQAAARARARLEPESFVLLYLGSLGPDYLLPQMIALFRQVTNLRPTARFLFVSNNGRNLVEAECRTQGVNPDSISFVSADRNDVPAYLSLADLSVVFIRADVSKAGCSPTKLAELFACDIPVIANTGVGDMDEIIDINRNNSVIVRDFGDQTLRNAVLQVLERKQLGISGIRERSREFSLEEGVGRYAKVYRELLVTESREGLQN
jgi:glycosyltransferase involved in cell wall biosynthesis